MFSSCPSLNMNISRKPFLLLLCLIGAVQLASIIDIDDDQIREAKSFGLHTSLGKSDRFLYVS